MTEFESANGTDALNIAAWGPQYDKSDGAQYGGDGPAWSNTMVHHVMDKFVKGARQVAYIDLHTGLGEFGVPEIWYSAEPDSEPEQRVWAWYEGRKASPERANTDSLGSNYGLIDLAVKHHLSDSEFTGICAEFGTIDMETVLASVFADNWLHARGDLGSPLAAEIKASLKQAFCPASEKWREMVARRGVGLLEEGVSGLATMG